MNQLTYATVCSGVECERCGRYFCAYEIDEDGLCEACAEEAEQEREEEESEECE